MGRIDVAVPHKRREEAETLDMSVMRIAVAGTGGLARLIGQHVQDSTSHHVVFLSRYQQAQLSSNGYQVAVVDYANRESLLFALRGIDTVISTVTGPNQIELIHAAAHARVRRFAPAEFEGLPQANTATGYLDRDRSRARQHLQHYSRGMQWTIFVCGILYERFQPGGLAVSGMRGASSGLSGEGDYLVNPRTFAAQVPMLENNPHAAYICMTAANDVARFVCRALDLPNWPPELRMCGQRFTVGEFITQVQNMRPQQTLSIQPHTPESLRGAYQIAAARGDYATLNRLQALINTLYGHYNFTEAHLNQLFPEIQPIDFQTWFVARWANQ